MNIGHGNLSDTLSQNGAQTFGITALSYRAIGLINKLGFLPWEFQLSRNQIQAIGLAAVLVLFVILQLFRSRGKVFIPDLSARLTKMELDSYVLIFTFSMVFTSYFLVSSYDYRMVHLVPLFLIGLHLKERYLLYGTLVAMWCEIRYLTSTFFQIPIFLIMTIMLFNVAPTLLSNIKLIGKSGDA